MKKNSFWKIGLVLIGIAAMLLCTCDGDNPGGNPGITQSNVASELIGLWESDETPDPYWTINFTSNNVTWGGIGGSVLNQPGYVWTAKNGEIKWKYSGTEMLAYTYTVSGNTLKITSQPGDTATYTLTKKVPVTGVTLNKTSLLLEVGGTETLTATVAPADATNKAVTWSTSNAAVATVSSGTVTAVGAGSATITVTTTDGSKTATCAVTVTPPPYDPNAADKTINIGKMGPGGGVIFYASQSGFEVTGTDSFTAYYLEAAPANMATTLAWASSGFTSIDIAGTATAIGTGKENTRLILATDANAPAAKACNEYSNGGKSDWFLPSKDELIEMYKAKTHLGILSGTFLSSTQHSINIAHGWSLGTGYDTTIDKSYNMDVRAVRAF